MQDAWLLIPIVASFIFAVRGVLWLRAIDQHIESDRIRSYRVERISKTRALVFDGKSHEERRPYYVVDITDEEPKHEKDEPIEADRELRYLTDIDKPDSKDRKLLLKIVRLSIRKYGAGSGLIASANLCKSESICDEPAWQGAIDFGVAMFGVKTEKRKSTYCGKPYLTLVDLEDAICKYRIVAPAPAEVDAETANNTGNNPTNSKR